MEPPVPSRTAMLKSRVHATGLTLKVNFIPSPKLKSETTQLYPESKGFSRAVS